MILADADLGSEGASVAAPRLLLLLLAAALTLLSKALRRHQLASADLIRLPGADPRKVAIAVELLQTTTASQGWIADRLHMKSAADVSQILRRQKGAKILSEYVD